MQLSFRFTYWVSALLMLMFTGSVQAGKPASPQTLLGLGEGEYELKSGPDVCPRGQFGWAGEGSDLRFQIGARFSMVEFGAPDARPRFIEGEGCQFTTFSRARKNEMRQVSRSICLPNQVGEVRHRLIVKPKEILLQMERFEGPDFDHLERAENHRCVYSR